MRPEDAPLAGPGDGAGADRTSASFEQVAVKEDSPKDAELANSFKSTGNEHFAAGRFSDALEWYTKAVDAAPLNTEFSQTLSVFYSNRSACHFELGNF